MGNVRYGARSEEQLRNREVEATSVDVWATTLVATYLTDPEVIAAVLPPPIEPGGDPLVKVTVATVDIPGYPTFGAGKLFGAGPARRNRRVLRAAHADDHRAVGHRRPRDLR